MKVFDNKGMLIIPEPDAIHLLKSGRAGQKKIMVKQLYCAQGHPLIKRENPEFDGKPGIHLLCRGEKISQSVYLSPFQADPRKKHGREFENGEILRICCPVCESEFPVFAPHDCKTGAMYVAIFLDETANLNHSVCICNAWGCYASFLRLAGEIHSEIQAQFFMR